MKTKSIKIEMISGIILFCSALIAIIIKNSSLESYYDLIQTVELEIRPGTILKKTFIDWINEGLMTIYFFRMGLEIRHALKEKTLIKSDLVCAMLVALFGLLVPACIYLVFNKNYPYLQGWAIPTATDIAFTMAIVSTLGARVPNSIKILVVAIAIFDDIGSIIIIGVFYNTNISITAIKKVIMYIGCLTLLRICNIKISIAYIFIGIIIWLNLNIAGIHPTISGVILALWMPDETISKTNIISTITNYFSNFFILPLFGFMNAGINFSTLSCFMITHPVFLGIFLGLFFGKQIGIFCSLYCLKKIKNFELIQGLSGYQLYGIAIICGIGFTMSLFIGILAFEEQQLTNIVKIAVMSASFFSGALGFFLLNRTHN